MHYIYYGDQNDDGIVTVREFLELFAEAVGYAYDPSVGQAYDPTLNGDSAVTNGGVTYDINDMIHKCGGEACDWIHNDEFMADVMSSGVDFYDYESLYARFEALDMPWVTDTMFELGVWNIPASHQQFVNVVQRLKYDESLLNCPDGWIPLEERLIPDIGEEPTEEQVVEFVKEEMESVTELFEEITDSDMTAEDFEISHDDIRKLYELLKLLERFAM